MSQLQRQRLSSAPLDGAPPTEGHSRASLRQLLGGLTYEEQVERVRPPMPVQMARSATGGRRAVSSSEDQREQPGVCSPSASPIDEADADLDHDRAVIAVDKHFDQLERLIDNERFARLVAVENFRQFTGIADAPSLGEELVTAALALAFGAFGGWELITRALELADIQARFETAIEAAELLEGGAGMLELPAEVSSRAGQRAHSWRTAILASDASHAALRIWSASAGSIIRNRYLLRDMLAQWRHQPRLQGTLEARIQAALGPTPNLVDQGDFTTALTNSFEAALYRARFRGSGADLRVSTSRDPRRRPTAEISGGGWTQAIEERLERLVPGLSGAEDVAAFVGLPERMIHPPDSPSDRHGRHTPGGPVD